MVDTKSEKGTVDFIGRGNTDWEAKELADVRLQAWRYEQKKSGKAIIEITKEYLYEARSAVHHKCTLKLTYQIGAQA